MMFNKRYIGICLFIFCTSPVVAVAQPALSLLGSPGPTDEQFKAQTPVDMVALNNVLIDAEKSKTVYADALAEAGYDDVLISSSKHFDGFRKNREEDFCIQLNENTEFNCDEPSQFTPLMAREVLLSIQVDYWVENRVLECNLTVLN